MRKECQISNNFNKDINSSDNLCPKNNDNNNNNEKIFFYRPFENTHNNKEKEVILGIQKYKTENSSNTTKSNKSKSLFIINEVLTKEKKDEENKIESQDSLLIKKRGRKQIKKNKKVHSALDDDNILRKIQVHFISFITNFINDIIRAFLKYKNVPLFKKIDYKLKKTINQKYFKTMKSLKIGEIIQMRPSPKLKTHDGSVNKKIYNEVCSVFPYMKEFLQQDFVNLFKEYFYNKNKIFIVNGKIIPLSDKTKTFNDLINKNYAFKEKLKFIALNCFLDDDTAINKFKFRTLKDTKDKND